MERGRGRNNLFLSHSDILVCNLGFLPQTERTPFGIDVGCAKPFMANKRPIVCHGKHAEPFPFRYTSPCEKLFDSVRIQIMVTFGEVQAQNLLVRFHQMKGNT